MIMEVALAQLLESNLIHCGFKCLYLVRYSVISHLFTEIVKLVEKDINSAILEALVKWK